MCKSIGFIVIIFNFLYFWQYICLPPNWLENKIKQSIRKFRLTKYELTENSIIVLLYTLIKLLLWWVSFCTIIFCNPPPSSHKPCSLYPLTDLTLTLIINQLSIPPGIKLAQHTALLFRFTGNTVFDIHLSSVDWSLYCFLICRKSVEKKLSLKKYRRWPLNFSYAGDIYYRLM